MVGSAVKLLCLNQILPDFVNSSLMLGTKIRLRIYILKFHFHTVYISITHVNEIQNIGIYFKKSWS